MLTTFARTMVRRRRLVVAAWVVALISIGVLSSTLGGDHRVDYTMPGSDSARAQRLLTERFPEFAGDSVQLVFQAPSGIRSNNVESAITDVQQQAAAVAHVTGVETSTVSPDETVSVARVQLDATAEKVPLETIHELMAIAEQADTELLTVDVGGAAVQNAEGGEAGSEQIGMMIALLILLVAFGSVIAAGLPILVALFGVGAAVITVPLLNNVFMIPEWATQLVTMICIGIGIDYALFIVTRYRTSLADGEHPEDAVVTAVTTAGRAVLFAGGTVVISLLGLCAFGLDYLYGTAGAMVVGVLAVLVASMTLLPALLGFAGRSIDRFHLPFVRDDAGEQGLWARWSRVVQRRPVATGAVALVLLLGLAAPFTSLRFGYPDAGTGPAELTSRRAYDAVTEAFGPGANSPLIVAVEPGGDPDVLDRLTTGLAADPGVAAVSPARPNATGDAAVITVTPSSGPQEEATVELIARLRDDVVPVAVGAGPADVAVGGATAAFVDESDYMAPRLVVFIAAVVSLSFLLLMVVFRSVLVALKAAAMNVLTIGAAYGVMALALQGGWLGGLIGIDESTPIPAWTPMMMFAILFGLSMDYEVFLLSRMREEYLRTRDNTAAVAEGMARTGRVISAAAAIMVTVFAAFMLSNQVLVKVIGLGLATAVLLDATVVRMVLVPSTMALLGDRNWWLPAWLDRILPRLDLEGGGGRAPSGDQGDPDVGDPGLVPTVVTVDLVADQPVLETIGGR
jgi:putative drug exporter of the RND superfamily